GRPDGLGDVQAALGPDVALVGWIDLYVEGVPATMPLHWACVVRGRGEPAWVRIDGSGPEGGWTDEDRQRPAAVRAALVENRPGWRELAAALARQRLEPLRPHLDGIKRLVELPSPGLAGVPIEALLDALPADTPRPVVSYAPSGTMFARLTRP